MASKYSRVFKEHYKPFDQKWPFTAQNPIFAALLSMQIAMEVQQLRCSAGDSEIKHDGQQDLETRIQTSGFHLRRTVPKARSSKRG